MLSTKIAMRLPFSSIARPSYRGLSGAGGGGGAFGAELFLELFDLRDAPAVTLDIGEVRAKIRANQLRGQLRADDARAQAQHVDAIVFDSLVGGKSVVTGGRANAAKLIG